MSTVQLVRGDAVIARLTNVSPDMPWFEARFVPEAGFADVEPLFQRELTLLEESDDFDGDAWQMVWEEIWASGVALVLADGTRLDSDFAVHVYDDGTARFRY